MTSLPPPTASHSLAPGSRAFLEAEGFEGFFTVGQLHAEACEGLPNEPGVYAIVRESLDPPRVPDQECRADLSAARTRRVRSTS